MNDFKSCFKSSFLVLGSSLEASWRQCLCYCVREQQISLSFPHCCFTALFSSYEDLDPPSDIHLPTSPKLNKKQIKASNVNLEVMWTVTDYFYWVSLKKTSKASVPSLSSFRGLALLEGKPSVLLFPRRRRNTEKLDYLESTSAVILRTSFLNLQCWATACVLQN